MWTLDGDAREIVAIGTRLLESPAPLSTDERAYLTTLIAATDVGLGQPAEAANLLEAKVSLVGEPGRLSTAPDRKAGTRRRRLCCAMIAPNRMRLSVDCETNHDQKA